MRKRVLNKGLSESSKKWVQRQLTDVYVEKAKEYGYRSRAAFKLIEINTRYDVLNGVCIDLGAAPGGWSQVAAKFCKRVYAVDLLQMDMLDNVEFICGDFTNQSVVDKLLNIARVDVVLSDMAPNTCGIKSADHLRIMELARQAFDFAQMVLTDGGNFVTKIFQGVEETDFVKTLKPRFKTVKYCKPSASRKESVEIYIVAKGFQK